MTSASLYAFLSLQATVRSDLMNLLRPSPLNNLLPLRMNPPFSKHLMFLTGIQTYAVVSVSQMHYP
ncbi:unnamed protein product [Dibothriocephalus latus]|uniref:Uncharacterized protein n=1 Tax=Dibothriocephalus latus TaxID=60516 RepID=A0A3P7LSC1_DIBLA|nr:unnamed protein product [Dibothriocephalus latus]